MVSIPLNSALTVPFSDQRHPLCPRQPAPGVEQRAMVSETKRGEEFETSQRVTPPTAFPDLGTGVQDRAWTGTADSEPHRRGHQEAGPEAKRPTSSRGSAISAADWHDPATPDHPADRGRDEDSG